VSPQSSTEPTPARWDPLCRSHRWRRFLLLPCTLDVAWDAASLDNTGACHLRRTLPAALDFDSLASRCSAFAAVTFR